MVIAVRVMSAGARCGFERKKALRETSGKIASSIP